MAAKLELFVVHGASEVLGGSRFKSRCTTLGYLFIIQEGRAPATTSAKQHGVFDRASPPGVEFLCVKSSCPVCVKRSKGLSGEALGHGTARPLCPRSHQTSPPWI